MDAATLGTLLGGLGIGSVATQIFANRSERKTYRAKALEAVGVIERVRWAPQQEGWAGLRQALIELESMALLAGVNRRAVDHYMYLARVAWTLSVAEWEDYPDPETGGGILREFAVIVDDAARLVTLCIWSPSLGGAQSWLRVRSLVRREAKVDHREIQEALGRFKRYGHSAF